MRILCDVDGVSCDFIGGYLSCIKKATGKEFKHEDVTDWSFQKCLNLTDDEIKATDALMHRPGFVLNLQSLSGTYRGIANLKDAGHDVVFVTSPWTGHPTWAHERSQWIEDRWPGSHVIHTHHKFYVDGDVLLDDKPSHLVEWKKQRPRGSCILFDQPYNQNIDVPAMRAKNWDDVTRGM